MAKDLIYIDIDDDITAIVEKVKKSKDENVALVPPKRVGVLQSSVNLRLIQRAAKTSKKRLSIVTVDKALGSLAGILGIPVARTVAAEPRIVTPQQLDPEVDSDTINGDEISIGELDDKHKKKLTARDDSDSKEIAAAVTAIETDDKVKGTSPSRRVSSDDATDAPKKPTKKGKGIRIPNFTKFRKWLFIGGGALVVLIVFFVWAIVFAPKGTITVTAKTSAQNISVVASLQPGASTDVEKSVIQPVVKESKKNESTTFTATGKRTSGDRATGEITISADGDFLQNNAKVSFAAGTIVRDTDTGLQYTIDSAVSFPSADDPFSLWQDLCDGNMSTCYITATVTATSHGANYNIDGGSELTVTGGYGAEANDDFTGGTTEEQIFVQQSDIDAAVEKIKNSLNQDQLRADLAGEMGDGVRVLDRSFVVSYGDPRSTPAASEEVENGRSPSVTIEVTLRLVGIANSDLNRFLDAQITTEGDDERIYTNGLDDVVFNNFSENGGNYRVTVETTAFVGPSIDENDIKSRAAGKKSGDIQATLEAIPGVDSVEVNLSPFWVSKAPSADKLTVEFNVEQ